MRKPIRITGVVLLLGAGLYAAVKVAADGIPSRQPFYYSGQLSEGGAPITGSRKLTINLWADADARDGERPLCATRADVTLADDGRFRVPLADGCKAEVQSHADTYVEVVVDGASLGRSKVGAVPYAAEAERASSAAAAHGALAELTVPSGALLAFDREECPAGWSVFDPAAGRTLIGANANGLNGLPAVTRGSVLGEQEHALSVLEMAPHHHGGATGASNKMSYRVVSAPGLERGLAQVTGYSGTAEFVDVEDNNFPMAGHNHALITDTGPGQSAPFTNLQPSLAVLYCRKN
jgi:microcystin-dependent protein